jgi:hypothetical protein
VGADHVRWTWSPEHDPEDRSDVTLTVAPAGSQTHLTVRESRRPAAAAGTATMSLAHPVGPTHRIEWIGELLTLAVWFHVRRAALLAV